VIGAALLLWGWQSGFLLVGALMGLVIEASRVVGLRWDFSERDFRRIWDFTTVLFVATAVYLFTSTEGPGALAGLLAGASPAAQSRAVSETAQAMLVLFRWAPMVFFLFVSAQAYSTTEFIPWTVFSLIRRRSQARQPPPLPNVPDGLNTANRYLAVCLLAACVPVQPNEWFYPCLALLVSAALWNRRSPRYRFATWALLVLAVMIGAFFAQRGFYQLAAWADAQSTAWLDQFVNRDTDPRENRTALGQIGRVKLSGKIVLRVQSKDDRAVPSLLREASYRFFRYPNWAGTGKIRDFAFVQTDTNSATWELAPGQHAEHALTIAQYLKGRGEGARRGLLALPHGIVRLENLVAFLVSTNRLGVVRVDEGPGLVLFDAYYRRGTTLDSPPDQDDLTIPLNEEAALGQVVNEFHRAGQSTNQILRNLAAFFTDKFQYSTWLAPPPRGRTNYTPLARFLLQTRSGHCEYFATAAVLLLRKAGVPARYAVGYAVQEKSGRQYLVRQRHAHAWCLVWVNGAWQDFDPTPASWVPAEEARASWMEWLTDAWSRLWFEFSKWRWGQARLRDYLLWALAPVLAVLLIRLVVGHRRRRLRRQELGSTAPLLQPGSDSEFYQIEQVLARQGLFRHENETPRYWLARIKNHPLLLALSDSVRGVLELHYRYRFDPAGLSSSEREALRVQARRCVENLCHPRKP
jgi:transglutaminase-like putative cysteine protease